MSSTLGCIMHYCCVKYPFFTNEPSSPTLGIIYLIIYELNLACYLIIPSQILAEFFATDITCVNFESNYLCHLWMSRLDQICN
jgi:hypothetical protein